MAKKKLPELRIEPVKAGQFIVHHSQNDMGMGKYKEPTKHIFTSTPSMLKHIKTTLQGKKRPASFKDAMVSMKAKKVKNTAADDFDGDE